MFSFIYLFIFLTTLSPVDEDPSHEPDHTLRKLFKVVWIE